MGKDGALVRTKRLSLFLAIVAFVAIGAPMAIVAMLYALKSAGALSTGCAS